MTIEKLENKILRHIKNKFFSPAILITGVFFGVEYVLENRPSAKWQKKTEYLKINNLN